MECGKTGKWDIEKKCENAGQINVGNINELIEKVRDLAVDDINIELKEFLINPALVFFLFFPQTKKTNLY